MMVGVTAALANDRHAGSSYYGSESVFFYLVTYALMTLGVFGGFMAIRFKDRPIDKVDDLLASDRRIPGRPWGSRSVC